MITINSIRVRNFRAIREATLEPLTEGITGIFGSNGAGKTSFLIAVMFALYGVRPEGATVSSLRRTGSEKEECSVSVVFTHLGQTVEVLREISGKNNTVKAWIYVDGKEINVGSVSYAEKWLKKRLGIDSEGFKTAFVVRQKELDLLVSAKPAERKSIIERLAGIETINAALKSAREEESGSKKLLGNLQGSVEDYNRAQELFLIEEGIHEKLDARIKTGLEKRDEAKKASDILERAFFEAKDQKHELDTEINRLNALIEEQNDKKRELEEANLRHGGMTSEKLESLQMQYQALDNDLEAKRKEYADLNVQSKVAEQNLSNLQAEIDKLSTLIEPSKPSTTLEDIDEKITVFDEKKNTLIVERMTLATRKGSIEGALEANGDADECPTCLRAWEAHDTKDYEKELKDIIKKIDDIVKDEEFVSSQISSLRSEKNTLGETIRAYTSWEVSVKRIKELSVELANEKKNIVSSKTLETILADGKALSATRDEVYSQYSEAKTALTYAEKVETLTLAIKHISDLIPALEDGIQARKEKLPDMDSLEAEYTEAKSLLERIDVTLSEVQNEYNLHNVTYVAAMTERDNQKGLYEARQEAHAKHEQIVATTEVLDKFRKDSIARLAPELSDYATSLISEMTSGAFTEIILDENFTPSVTDSEGNTRPVTWLSGGEESAVALALRLSIAFLITGGNPELLWLDEVLTAQDADRRQAMLGMIRALPINQILIINHTQEAADVVDKTVTLIPNLREGSTLEAS